MIIAIRQIRILDGLGHRIERGTLLIEGTRIQAVGPEQAGSDS
jgi:imidazolonepropionase-like amidohydrolase